MFRSFFKVVAFLAVVVASPAVAQVSADFTTGAIAEYSSNNANRNDNTKSFATLGISKITMSQSGTSWGGTQGNDLSVTLTITFTDNSTYTAPSAVLNWQKNASAGGVDYFGVTTSTVAPDASDRYTRSSNLLKKTYILALPGNLASSGFSGLIASDGTDGSANFSPADVFAALQADFPAPNAPTTDVAPTFSNLTAGNGTSYSFNYAENSASGTSLGTVSATDPENAALTFSITAGDANGWFAIDPATGEITLTVAGAASLANDFEQTPNVQTLTVEVSDGTNRTAVQVALNETNVDDTAPVFTSTNATDGSSNPSYSFSYAENRATGATLGTVSATGTGTLSYSITTGNGSSWFAIDASTGAITLIAAGSTSLANDFEQSPNVQTLTVQVSDGTRTTTIEVKLNETNVDDTPPVITGPGGVAGATTAAISVNENQTAVTTPTANETVTWSLVGGEDQAKFAIDPTTGALSFVAAPDYETPTDGSTSGSNTYIVQVKALDATGNFSLQTITVTVLNIDDSPPAITGPTGSAGAANDTISVNEGQTAVARLIATETVTWSITSGNDQGKFRIAADGTITFVAAPDFESPTDTDTNNTYVLTVAARDAAGNVSTQTITVTVLNVDDTAPVITGPSGGAGAAVSAISVDEAQTAVTRLVANETVTWSITGGSDATKLAIAADGTITFLAAPDFEIPTDADTNNTYVLTATATDVAGNVSTQTITVTVLDIDDTAPAITGPSGGPGAAASALTTTEGLTAVTRFTANEPVTWSIDSGADAAKFRIDAATGTIVFVAAPDFENPTDGDRNNTYIVRIKAVDAAGNVSFQTLTVTITNVDEIARKLAQIGDKLRGSLRNYAAHGLSDMLAFNESLMASNDDFCADPKTQKALSGSARANENGANLDVKYAQRLSECSRPHQLFADAGLSSSRMGGNWNSRIFGALRFETKFNDEITLGLAALVSRSSDELNGFDTSSISDKSLQVNAYGRYRISDALRTGAFIGFGHTSYDFALTESDGFDLNGSMTGKRQVYGWMLSGDFNLGETVVTTDAVISHAREKIGSAILAARYLGENRSGIAFGVGTVDVTRISVPVTAPISLSGSPDYGSWSRLLLSPGLLCEDNDVQSSGLRCGYQLGAKFVANDGARGRFYADYNWESVAGMRRSLIGVGFAYRIGEKNNLELAVEASRGVTVFTGQDNRAMLAIRLAQ